MQLGVGARDRSRSRSPAGTGAAAAARWSAGPRWRRIARAASVAPSKRDRAQTQPVAVEHEGRRRAAVPLGAASASRAPASPSGRARRRAPPSRPASRAGGSPRGGRGGRSSVRMSIPFARLSERDDSLLARWSIRVIAFSSVTSCFNGRGDTWYASAEKLNGRTLMINSSHARGSARSSPPQHSRWLRSRRGAELSDPAGHHRRAVRRRQRDRHPGAHPRRRGSQALGPAGHRREPARARRHRRRGEGGARRLHPDADLERPYGRGAGEQEPAVRSGQGLCRHHPRELGAALSDHQSRGSGQEPQGADRAGQGEARHAQFLLARASPARPSSPARCFARPPASISCTCRSRARPTR